MRILLASFALAVVGIIAGVGARAEPLSGDAKQGAQLYRACAACHSLTPDRNMTGPSLAGIWGRKAGSLKSFERYSPALKASNVVWGENTLDQWLKSPAQFIPNNHMTFTGIPNARQRADLIAFLKEAGSGQPPTAEGQGGGGMMGGMAPQFHDLKKLGLDRQVRAIRICHDSYFVTTANGKTTPFWEANLRFKTDSSDTGPLRGKPVILPAGMMGDRASVFFAAPEEISQFIKHQCRGEAHDQ
ncbi:MAG: cytochrome c family protein [Alphaproteobacteria bacterium]|nr:cytochrome c family protein [Alphaproteobacteria bacterium]